MTIPIRKLFLLLLFFVLILLLMHLFPSSLSCIIRNKFNLNGEANVPTWYSTVLLFSVALSSLIIYLRGKTTAYNNNLWWSFWLGFSAVYCFLSLDEAACLHEIIDQYISIKWIFIYAPFAGMFFMACVCYLIVIRNDSKTLRNWILGGLVIYAAGGLICEAINCLLYPLSPTLQQVEHIFEEGLELVGTIMVLMGCLHELNRVTNWGEPQCPHRMGQSV
jgi:hypothetical protein